MTIEPISAAISATTPRLRSDPTFRRYWSAHTISAMGSTVSLVVLPILMYQRTSSALLTALLGAVYTAPYVLLGPFAGAFADRTDRQRLMVAADLASAAALGSIPIASGLGALTTAHLFIATIAAGCAFLAFDSAQFGAMPALFGRVRLVSAMTALGSVDNLLYVGGTAVGGVLASTIGAAPSVGIDAASFLVSALIIQRITGTFRTSETPTASARQWRTEIAEGFQFLWRHTVLRALTLAGAAASLTGGAVTGLLVVFAVRALGLTDHDPRIGLAFGAAALGAFIGTTLISKLTRRFEIPTVNLVSRTLSLALVAAFAFQHQIIAALVLLTAFSAAESIAIWSAIAFRQLNTPDHLQGRVNVLGRMIALAGQPIGAALGGVLAQVTDVRLAIVIMSGGLVCSTIGGWYSITRGARHQAPTTETAGADDPTPANPQPVAQPD